MNNVREYETNWEFQKMFADNQLPGVPLYEVFFYESRFKPPVKQQFFFYEGKWRNTDSKSKFSAVTFMENQIRSRAFITL